VAEVKHLLLDLATLECRLASFAMAGGNPRLGGELIARACYLLGLRNPDTSFSPRLQKR
jgi:hypothetical protein